MRCCRLLGKTSNAVRELLRPVQGRSALSRLEAKARVAGAIAADSVNAVVAPAVAAFGMWTLACHLAAPLDLSFSMLVSAGATAAVAAAVVVAALTARPPPSTTANPRSLSSPQDESGLWLVAALAIAGAFWWTRNALAFWAAASALMAAACWRCRAAMHRDPEPPIDERIRAHAVVFILAVAGALITLVSHRPDADDAFFISIAADAFAHPDRPPMSGDTIYGEPGLPLLLPVYRVHSIELVAAALAHMLGGEPIFYAHLVVPTAFALLLPFAWASMLRLVLPRRWCAATVLVFFLLLVMGETHKSWGNFGYVRLFQGKAVLVSFFVPVIYARAWIYMRSGRALDWTLLLGSVIGAVGASSSGLFVVPGALAIALASAWHSGQTARCVAGALTALYPITLAVALHRQAADALTIFSKSAPSLDDTIAQQLGDHQQFFALFLVLIAWLAPDHVKPRWKLAATAFLFMVGPLNPLFADPIANYVTTNIVYWRLFWILPLPILCACGMIAVGELLVATLSSERLRPDATRSLAAVLLLVPFLPGSVFRSDNMTVVGRPRLKVPQEDYRAAQLLIRATARDRSMLAPEPVAVWVSTAAFHPPLLLSRLGYVFWLSAHLGPSVVADRILVEAVATGRAPFNEQAGTALTRLVTEQHLGALAVAAAADAEIVNTAKALGFEMAFDSGRYRIFALGRERIAKQGSDTVSLRGQD